MYINKFAVNLLFLLLFCGKAFAGTTGPGPGPGNRYPEGNMSFLQYRHARHILRAAETLLDSKHPDPDAAIALLKDSIPLIPMGSNIRWHQLMGKAQVQKGDTVAAFRHFEAAIAYGDRGESGEKSPFVRLSPKDSARLAYLWQHADSLQQGIIELDLLARLDSLDRADQQLRWGYSSEYPALADAMRRNEAYLRHLWQNDPKGFPSALRVGESSDAMFMLLVHASDSFRLEFFPILFGLALQNKFSWHDVETLYEPLTRGGSDTYTFFTPALLEFTSDGHIANTLVNDFILNYFVASKVMGCDPSYPAKCNAIRKYNSYGKDGQEFKIAALQYRGEPIEVAQHYQPATADLFRYLTDACHMNPEAIQMQEAPQWIERQPWPGAAHIGIRFLMPSEYAE